MDIKFQPHSISSNIFILENRFSVVWQFDLDLEMTLTCL